MAIIAPFRALRYAPSINLTDVVTQPYDKISPELWRTYKGRHPRNLVNLILPDEEAATARGMSKYDLAASMLQDWLKKGVVACDATPGFYPYRQSFGIFGEDHVREGFIGLIKTEDYANRVVFPHEKTLSKPKADRFSLLSATRVHFGLIFLLYEDDGAAQDVLAKAMQKKPVGTLNDDFRVHNELWHLSDPAQVAVLQNALASKQVFIADGHHRYETSLRYAGEHREDPHAQFTVAMFINVRAPLVVLPTHRTLAGIPGFVRASLRSALEPLFAIETCGSLDATIDATKAHDDRVVIGGFDGREFFAATLKDPAAMRLAVPNASDAWRALDVAVLHSLIIEKTLAMSAAQVENEAGIRYHRDPAEAAALVSSGDAQCAFFLRGTRPSQVCDVARNGEVMPQKSTDFYPKLLSGMAMYALDLQS